MTVEFISNRQQNLFPSYWPLPLSRLMFIMSRCAVSTIVLLLILTFTAVHCENILRRATRLPNGPRYGGILAGNPGVTRLGGDLPQSPVKLPAGAGYPLCAHNCARTQRRASRGRTFRRTAVHSRNNFRYVISSRRSQCYRPKRARPLPLSTRTSRRLSSRVYRLAPSSRAVGCRLR